MYYWKHPKDSKHFTFLLLAIFVLLLSSCTTLKSKPKENIDPDFNPIINNPAFPKAKGPYVFIDAGHNNYHTMDDGYKPFAALLQKDGFQVFAHEGEFTSLSLESVDILVIVNPIHRSNIESWMLPTPSAFTLIEILTLNEWVKAGGALWLISDHMPIPGAAEKLASSFGFNFMNGFAHNASKKRHIRFSRENNTLNDHVITNGNNSEEKINAVYTYTGHAFQIPAQATSLLEFEPNSFSLNPNTAFEFDATTPKVNIGGWSQAAARPYGDGKLFVQGEAGMFIASLSEKDQRKIGMNSPLAPDNAQFALNIIRWLSSK